MGFLIAVLGLVSSRLKLHLHPRQVQGGGFQLLVPEQDLDQADIDLLLFQQMGGETVPQGVHRHPLVDLGELGGGVDGPVELPCAERLDRVQPRKQPAAVEHLALGAGDLPPDAQPRASVSDHCAESEGYRASGLVLRVESVSRTFAVKPSLVLVSDRS